MKVPQMALDAKWQILLQWPLVGNLYNLHLEP